MIAVKLHHARYGAGPATVMAHVESVSEYHARFRDRDGVIPEDMRLWHYDGDSTAHAPQFRADTT